jgi:hypothetical protein
VAFPEQRKSESTSFLGLFRWAFLPLGLLSLVAVGVHLAADALDDALLPSLQILDVWFDALFAQSSVTASWVNAIESKEQTLIARIISLALELMADFFFAIPLLGFTTSVPSTSVLLIQPAKPKADFRKPVVLLLPVITLLFVFAGSFAVSRLVESTLFLGLSGDVASPDVAAILARGLSITSVILVLLSLGIHAATDAFERAKKITQASGYFIGLWRCLLALPLCIVLCIEAFTFLFRVTP